MKQLADEGHWLIDNLDAGRRDFVVHLVPAVPRFILVNFLGGPVQEEDHPAVGWHACRRGAVAVCRRLPQVRRVSVAVTCDASGRMLEGFRRPLGSQVQVSPVGRGNLHR